MGRTSQGVIGIRLDEGDEVISMLRYCENTTLLVVTENGFGKRTEMDEYKVQNRVVKEYSLIRLQRKQEYLLVQSW